MEARGGEIAFVGGLEEEWNWVDHWALWAIEQRVVVLMCDFWKGGKGEEGDPLCGYCCLGGDKGLGLLLKRSFVGLRTLVELWEGE